MTTATERVVTIRAKAFTGQRVRQHRVLVGADSVRVWDSVAGHYTACHVLSASARRRAEKLAAK